MCSNFGPNDFDEGSWAFDHIKVRLSSQRCHFHFLCDYHLPHPTRKPLHSSSCTFVSESCQRSSKSGMQTLDLQSPCQIPCVIDCSEPPHLTCYYRCIFCFPLPYALHLPTFDVLVCTHSAQHSHSQRCYWILAQNHWWQEHQDRCGERKSKVEWVMKEQCHTNTGSWRLTRDWV